MRFHYDLTGQGSPLVRDMAIYDTGTITCGQILCINSAATGTCLTDPTAVGTIQDAVGIAMETSTDCATALTTGTMKYVKTCINPLAVYLAQWDPSTTADVDVSSSTTAAVTLATTDDNMDGGWVYCNSGTGVGQLGFIGAASTTVMTLDTTSAFGTAPDSTTDILLIRPAMAFAAGSGNNTDATFSMLLSACACTGEILLLENYIQAATVPFGPLRPRQHHGLSNLNNQAVKFYADAYMTDNALRGATTMYTS